MGIKERQERDREAVRRSILDAAARELFVSEGYQNVSIRKIAERIELRPRGHLRHFPPRRHLLRAGRGGVPPAAPPAPNRQTLPSRPLETVRKMLWHFYEFSVEQPPAFRPDVRRSLMALRSSGFTSALCLRKRPNKS